MYKVDPTISLIKDEHIELAKYMRERVMSIEVFDADSLMHLGSAKVPLYKVLRQGRLVAAKGLDCEVCESQHGTIVGTLQLLITNQSCEPSNPKAFEEPLSKRA